MSSPVFVTGELGLSILNVRCDFDGCLEFSYVYSSWQDTSISLLLKDKGNGSDSSPVVMIFNINNEVTDCVGANFNSKWCLIKPRLFQGPAYINVVRTYKACSRVYVLS